MKKVSSMAEFSGDGTKQTIKQALESALEEVGERGAFEHGKKILILALEEGDNKDLYKISFVQAGMKMSECLTLCEVAKTLFLDEMGYI